MAFDIQNHRLVGPKVKPFKQSPNTSGKFRPGNMDTIIIHYTASPSADASIRNLTRRGSRASAHMVVDYDGSITQLVDFDTIAWHAGRSAYNGRRGFNKYSIGIEIENAGLLTKKGSSYLAWFKKSYPVDEVAVGKHRNGGPMQYWHKYTDAQIEVVEEICEAIIKEYGVKYILGHEEISPGRKIDPGPAYPLDEQRNRLLTGGGVADDEGSSDGTRTGMVRTRLNIRESGTTSAAKIARPLPQGLRVKILDDRNDWLYVEAKVTGWLFKDYVTLDNSDDDGDGIVSASALNIRSGPNSSADKVARPLPRDTKVDILTQRNNWYQVNAPIKGWVAKAYVKLN